MRHFFAFTVSSLFISPLVMAQQYTGAVLYSLAPPYGMAASGAQGSVAAQTVGYGLNSGVQHALIWSAPNGTTTDVTPAGFLQADLYETNGIQQVGDAWNGPTTAPNQSQAILWSGSATSAVNLNPPGFAYSIAEGLNGNQQVGLAYTSAVENLYHAILWTGSAASAVDLNPAGFSDSSATGIDGNYEVGSRLNATTGNNHALLWSGTAASAVDLNPAGFISSIALGISGNQQVGDGTPTSPANNLHALLWTGTAASVVDLNPTNLTGIPISYAQATNGTEQVGYGRGIGTGFNWNALLWSGTASSTVNLQSLLPAAGTWQDSSAYSIDANGNVFGVADGTLDGISGEFAVEWSPVPEPASYFILAASALGLLRRRQVC